MSVQQPQITSLLLGSDYTTANVWIKRIIGVIIGVLYAFNKYTKHQYDQENDFWFIKPVYQIQPNFLSSKLLCMLSEWLIAETEQLATCFFPIWLEELCLYRQSHVPLSLYICCWKIWCFPIWNSSNLAEDLPGLPPLE